MIKTFCARWPFFVILKIIDHELEAKQHFRELEKIQAKVTKKDLDIFFNKKCLALDHTKYINTPTPN